MRRRAIIIGFLVGTAGCGVTAALAPVPVTTNVTFRVLASNLTGNSQRYEL